EILAGAYRRGSFRMIPAIILITDLKGFTALANRVDQAAVTQVLNQCFDAMVAPIRNHGGEVLKFLGDGLLAVFEHRGNEAADLCLEALNAAKEAVNAVALIDRPGEPGITMELDAALHLGEVFYGNVGAADRLDFTILGPAVNEASRIESLCSILGHPILMSQSFADKALGCRGEMISAGEHVLRGTEGSQTLYALKPEPDQ
ncbi:MAG: adenylate/guanylate cyclase domain-containing protein, partial [Alphaproteobacteria bacterium]